MLKSNHVDDPVFDFNLTSKNSINDDTLSRINKVGEVLVSGVVILEKTKIKDSNKSYCYKQKCGVCNKVFISRYREDTKSCGCLRKTDPDIGIIPLKNAAASNMRFGTNLGRVSSCKNYSNNSTGVKGVSYFKNTGMYRAYITFQGHTKNLGHFDTLDEASVARKIAEIQRDEFLHWYNSLSDIEKDLASENYKESLMTLFG